MSPRRHNRHLLLDLYSWFLIPTYTLLFAGSRAWFRTNFSVLAVLGEDFYRGFVFWAFVTMGFYCVLLTRLALAVPRASLRRGVLLLTLAAGLSLSYAVFIPYLPQEIPFWAALHVALAAGSCVLLLAAILLLLLYWRDWELLRMWLILNGCYGVLFLLGGMVTTALEVFFILSTVLLVRKMWQIKKP